MPTSTLVKTVPPLIRQVTGFSYGGQYFQQAEFEITFETDLSGGATVTLADTADITRYSLHLNATQLAATLDLLGTAEAGINHPEPVPGLGIRPVWVIGDDNDFVDITYSHLDEVREWLKYATGALAWDGDDDWEY